MAETPAPEEFSPRLGRIRPDQFQAALDRFELGAFVRAEPIRFGNFGQVLYLSASSGEYVLRGAPHWPWQFFEEQYVARLLHERTSVPVPWPYLVDDSAAIFGWSYVIMPRLPGLQIEDKELSASLTPDDRRAIARALGQTLAEMQRLAHAYAGAFDPKTRTFQPLAAPYDAWVLHRIRENLSKARAHSPLVTTDDDERWVEDLIADAHGALAEPFEPTFVMPDYKDQNALVAPTVDGWVVSGVFDIGGWFGDGEAALSRQVAMYLERDAALAAEYVASYLAQKAPRPGFAERFPIYMLDERLAIWEWAQREQLAWWDTSLTLREWAGGFTAAYPMIAVI